MDSQPEGLPQSLLVHDGELDDLRVVLEELGTPFAERRGSLQGDDATRDWDLVLSTPGRMLALDLAGKPARIVVADTDSRTLRNSLHRAGIKTLVRRPVHPSALRAIVLHAVYRGPEKRRTKRVAVGAPVRMRVGLRQFPAILADLSLGGCRIITSRTLKPGRTFVLSIAAEVARGRSCRLVARTVRSSPTKHGANGTHLVQARFEPLSQRKLKLLKETILAYRGGPAQLADGDDTLGNAAEPEAAPARSPAPQRPAPQNASPAPLMERRLEPRREIEQRVVALDAEADRVLMGRDISVGGMRVSPSPHLTAGSDVKLAVHLSGDAPLVIRARVHRDDGEQGVVLRFHQLSAEASAALLNMMETTPVVAPGAADDEAGCIVSELLEVGTA